MGLDYMFYRFKELKFLATIIPIYQPCSYFLIVGPLNAVVLVVAVDVL